MEKEGKDKKEKEKCLSSVSVQARFKKKMSWKYKMYRQMNLIYTVPE